MDKCRSLPGRASSCSDDTDVGRSLSMERLRQNSLREDLDKDDSSKAASGPEKEVKVVILGPPEVGKSALVVRYLTKRYIGDYADCESICTGNTVWGYKRFKVHLLDTKGDDLSETLGDDKFSWADACLIVYSIADQESFTQTKTLVEAIVSKQLKDSCAFVLVGNKSDLEHLRQVPAADGQKLAAILNCPYVEASARESYTTTVKAFSTLFLELKYQQRRKSKEKKAEKGPERRNASSTVLHQLRDSLRNLASEFRQRTNTY